VILLIFIAVIYDSSNRKQSSWSEHVGSTIGQSRNPEAPHRENGYVYQDFKNLTQVNGVINDGFKKENEKLGWIQLSVEDAKIKLSVLERGFQPGFSQVREDVVRWAEPITEDEIADLKAALVKASEWSLIAYT
jgi:hypothetical protein